MKLESGNPAMIALDRWDQTFLTDQARPKAMTIGGTVTATAILLAIVSAVGVVVFQQLTTAARAAQVAGQPMSLPGWTMPALIGSFIATLVISFVIFKKPKVAPVLAPIHAAIEGVFVGALSFMIPVRFLGQTEFFGTDGATTLIMQAVLATFGICAAMLTGYATGVLRVGPFVQKVIVTLGIGLLFYTVALWLLSKFGVGIWNGYADTGIVGIGFTVFCLGLASLFLLLDFKFIEEGVKSGAPKYMEWVGAWGLMVTLVWVYIEVLRLLSKLRSE